jgi:hypothetical protein
MRLKVGIIGKLRKFGFILFFQIPHFPFPKMLSYVGSAEKLKKYFFNLRLIVEPNVLILGELVFPLLV